jgi:hypothetical protein
VRELDNEMFMYAGLAFKKASEKKPNHLMKNVCQSFTHFRLSRNTDCSQSLLYFKMPLKLHLIANVSALQGHLQATVY